MSERSVGEMTWMRGAGRIMAEEGSSINIILKNDLSSFLSSGSAEHQ